MTLHIVRAALQLLLFLPLRVILILLGLLVVPLALPFLDIKNPPVAFTEAPGYWGLGTLPKWAWLWSNDRDGALGDKRGWWHLNAPFGLGAYHWFSQFWWLAIRNPANNMRFTPWFSCPLTECSYEYWGNEVVKGVHRENGNFRTISPADSPKSLRCAVGVRMEYTSLRRQDDYSPHVRLGFISAFSDAAASTSTTST